MKQNYSQLLQQVLERRLTRREFILYALALIPIVFGISGLMEKLLKADQHFGGTKKAEGYGARNYGK